MKISDKKLFYEQFEVTLKYPFFGRFIQNKNKHILTKKQNDYYIMFEKTSFLIDKYKYNFSNYNSVIWLFFLDNTISFSWFDKWIFRFYYIENEYKSIKGKYLLLDDSINYYMGLLKLSISFVKEYRDKKMLSFINHISLLEKDYFNPTNVIVDIMERDVGEYLKIIYFSGEYVNFDYDDFFSWCSVNGYNFNLIIGRVLYPNYYFELFDKMCSGVYEEDKLKKIISNCSDFCNYVNFLIDKASLFYSIKKISL